jgi:signal transduction histidine kinase
MAAIGELAAGIAHEINNPAGYVSGNLETLAKYIKRIKQYIDHTRAGLEEIVQNPNPSGAFMNYLEQNTKMFKELKIEVISDDLESIIADSQEGVKKISSIVWYLMSFSGTGDKADRVLCSVNEISGRCF